MERQESEAKGRKRKWRKMEMEKRNPRVPTV